MTHGDVHVLDYSADSEYLHQRWESSLVRYLP